MAIDLKNLSKTIALCRKTGVLELEVDGIKLKLSPDSINQKTKKHKGPELVDDTPQYTDEELLTWSVSGIPMDGVS